MFRATLPLPHDSKVQGWEEMRLKAQTRVLRVDWKFRNSYCGVNDSSFLYIRHNNVISINGTSLLKNNV
jgi:hypothetical protein